MNKQLTLIQISATGAITAGAMSPANAALFFRARVAVAPVASVVAAPVAVAPVSVPTCRLVAVPFVNAWTGATYSVTRRVCN